MSKNDMRAVGPPVSAFPFGDANIQMAIEAQGLDDMAPLFYDPEDSGVRPFLAAHEPSFKPEEVTFTLPEVVAVWFESFTGAEPNLGFEHFVKGVACAALLVEPAQLELVKTVIRMLAEKVLGGAGLPRLDARFSDDIRDCLAVIFSNGEPMSWRPLMAFCMGMFWLLGFVVDPDKPVGKLSPQGFCRGVSMHYGGLGYLPN